MRFYYLCCRLQKRFALALQSGVLGGNTFLDADEVALALADAHDYEMCSMPTSSHPPGAGMMKALKKKNDSGRVGSFSTIRMQSMVHLSLSTSGFKIKFKMLIGYCDPGVFKFR